MCPKTQLGGRRTKMNQQKMLKISNFALVFQKDSLHKSSPGGAASYSAQIILK